MFRDQYIEVTANIAIVHPWKDHTESVVGRVLYYPKDRQNMLIVHVERHQRMPIENLARNVR